jgi:hypothetical protein
MRHPKGAADLVAHTILDNPRGPKGGRVMLPVGMCYRYRTPHFASCIVDEGQPRAGQYRFAAVVRWRPKLFLKAYGA